MENNTDMQQMFEQFWNEHFAFDSKGKVLLTVSGGVDSMLMFHLFENQHIPYAVAHCNFQLRGEDSFKDEQFVIENAKKTGVVCHSTRFDTQTYAQQNGLSIQMAARELRYNWFQKLCKIHDYQYIATAHHQDDLVETFLLNLLRKTGISGLHSIQLKAENVIRPMLFVRKKQILDYAHSQNITYREDVSNKDDHYLRNYIRLHIIPQFENIQPDFGNTLLNSIDIISRQEQIYRTHIDNIYKKTVQKCKNYYQIAIENISVLPHAQTYLYELLKPFGSNWTQIENLYHCLDNQEEKVFFTPTFKICKTRNSIDIFPLQNQTKEVAVYENITKENLYSKSINFKICEFSKSFKINPSSQFAYFDLDKLVFPLRVRTWQHGDTFYPFGGKGKRKLSDYFTDNQFNTHQKQTTPILCNGNGDILWIVGYRSDNRYKINKLTKKILQCKVRG